MLSPQIDARGALCSLKATLSAGCRSICIDFHDDGVERVEDVGFTAIKAFNGALDIRERENSGCLAQLVT
jgi:hypothetical protein